MIVTDLRCGQSVQIGSYTLQVRAVQSGQVEFALFDPGQDCAGCGQRPAQRRNCSVCAIEVMVCRLCARSWPCPQCASSWD